MDPALLLSLLRTALLGGPVDNSALQQLLALDDKGWEALLETAEKQTVSGLLYQAAEKLPPGFSLSEEVLMTLMQRVNRIVNRNHRLSGVQEEVLQVLCGGGFQPLVMKGSSCAARYPAPELRSSGDIDLYLPPEDFPRVLPLLEAAGYTLSPSPDGSVVSEIRGCVVELHRQYFDLSAPADTLPAVPSPEAELVMLSSHILKHACGVGVGLRQICDFALAWRQYTGDRAALEERFRRLGLEKWNRLLLSFIQAYLDPSVNVRAVSPKPLLDIVFGGGNFGHHSAAREASLGRSPLLRKADTALRLLGRLPFALRYAPREAWANFRRLVRGNLGH